MELSQAEPLPGPALRLAAWFGLATFALHLVTNWYGAHIGWGYFRDEFYYIACGRHLAWGYVDHGPLVAVQARVSELLFGRSLVGLRLLAGLAGGLRVALTGVLAWALGGRRPAQGLAMTAISLVPQYLGTDSYLSMNTWESFFWMSALLAVLRLLGGGDGRWWLVFGVAGGLGVLNKHSMAFFLLSLLLALLLTPARRVLRSRWAVAGVAVLLLLALPNLLWQVGHGWPTLEFLENGRRFHKTVVLGPLAFIGTQVLNMGPLTLLIWLPGLLWLLRRPSVRWLGLCFCLFLVLMLALHAKAYYVAPIYPVLFAAGGLAWEQRFAARRSVQRGGFLAFPIAQTTLTLAGLLVLPMSAAVLSPESFLRYATALHLANTGQTERYSSGPLPQFFADRFGWQEEVDAVERIVRTLSPEDRARLTIVTGNYGEAGALDFLGHGLPPALCGQNNYFLWGTHGQDGAVVLAILGDTPEEIARTYEHVEIVGRMDHPYSMGFEHRNLYLLRGLKRPWSTVWAEQKDFI